MSDKITPADVIEPGERYWEQMDTVTFHSNSRFALGSLVANKPTAGRSYRQTMLEMSKTVNALEENKALRQKAEVRIRMNDRATGALLLWSRLLRWLPFLSEHLKDRAELLEIEGRRLRHEFRYQDKLVRDAVEYLKGCVGIVQALPEYTREKVEAEEKAYYEAQLRNDARLQLLGKGWIEPGTLESLELIGYDAAAFKMTMGHRVNAELKAAGQELEKVLQSGPCSPESSSTSATAAKTPEPSSSPATS